LGELDNLDKRKEWVDWVGKYSKSIEEDLTKKRQKQYRV
jgi:hypothetical protein